MDYIPIRDIGDNIRIMDTLTARERGIENIKGKIIDIDDDSCLVQTEDDKIWVPLSGVAKI